MKLHRLEITAFGPFAGHEVVEFDELNQAGVFLLNGETGSGKTSVLDAICFALYSSAPTTVTMGGRKPGHSDHAEPDTAPLVELEFTASGRRWHISRSPAWRRPSTRAASGWSEQHAKVLLREYVAGEWIERGHRPDEVAQMVEHTVGLNREQFTQVMMLPQGRFAQFLRAGSKEREQLLETLFGTDIYPRIQRELKDLAAAGQAELDALRLDQQRDHQRLSQLDRQLAEVLGDLPEGTVRVPRGRSPGADALRPEDSPPEDQSPSEEVPSAEELAEAVGTALSQLALARDAIAAEQTRTAERARELKHRLGNMERLEQLTGLRRELHAQRDAVADQEETLTRHRAAHKLSGLVSAADSARSEVEHAQSSTDAARQVLSEISPQRDRYLRVLGADSAVLQEWNRGEQDLATVRDVVVNARGAAEQALEAEDSVRKLERAVTDADKHTAELRTRRDTLENTVRHDVAERASAERTAEELGEVTRDAGVIRERHERARRVLSASEEFQRLAAERDSLGERYRAAEQTRRGAAQRVEELEAQRFASAVATLASALREGEPCPVCGATAHPAPADREAGSHVTESALTRSREERDQAQVQADRAHEAWQVAQQRAAGALGAGAQEDISSARAAVEESTRAVARLEHSLQQVQESTERLAALDRRLEETRTTLRDVELQIERSATLATTTQSQLKEARQRLNRELYGFESVRERLSTAQDLLDAVSAVETAQRALDRAAQEHEYSRNTLRLELEDSPFSSSDDVRSALLEPAVARKIEERLENYREKLDRVTAELATDTMVDTARLSPEERAATTPDTVERALRDSENLATRRDRLTAASGTLGALERSVGELSRSEGERAELLTRAHEKAERLTGLSAVANGLSSDNSLRMTLTSFVLAAKLEHVAAVASEHLRRMSSGRFSLIHTDQARGGGKAGLGLEVDDSWTGNRRGTETLSGGESFFTSLALALALADVVRASAGGQEMDTLFVDEGFGSLDEDTLEHVLETIDGLRQNGRVIGLVSHVAEMKQRIGTQLVVTKTPRGSHLRVITGPEATA